jgi:hypothetical protein
MFNVGSIREWLHHRWLDSGGEENPTCIRQATCGLSSTLCSVRQLLINITLGVVTRVIFAQQCQSCYWCKGPLDSAMLSLARESRIKGAVPGRTVSS